MKNLAQLGYVLEIMRTMPQYGFAISGGNDRLGNLAEHHYLVTMLTWQLAQNAKNAGGKIDVLKAVEFSLIHDMGELFGGDISMPYAIANPEARKKAKAFEAENQKFIAKLFGENQKYYEDISEEILDAKSDEAIVSKVADYVEITTYKQFIGRFSKNDIDLIIPKLKEKVSHIKDIKTRKVVKKFVDDYIKETKNFKFFDVKVKEVLYTK